MTSRVSADKSDDAEQHSISLLQSDAEAVNTDFRLRLTVLDLIEEGHKAAGIAISAALVVGIVLGLSLPVDHNVPGNYARASNILGWTYFSCWWIGWYPQLIQNALLESVVGISFDFMLYNWIGFVCYSAFNLGLYLHPGIRQEYRETHGGQNSDVRANDLAFSLHCNLMSTLMLLQMLWYKGGGQRVTAVCWTSTAGFFLVCGGYLLGAGLHWRGFTALGFLYLLSWLKLLTSLVKYFPQVYLNFQRKSTIGWSVSNALTDMSGGLFSLAQQSLDAYALRDISIVTGDPVKFGLALVSILYCVVLLVQHFILYRERRPSHYGPAERKPAEPNDSQAGSSLLRSGSSCNNHTMDAV